MSTLAAIHGAALKLTGHPLERGRRQALGQDVQTAARAYGATVGRVLEARSEGWITPEMLDYIDCQRHFAESHCPESMAEVTGIANGFGLDKEALFLHLHLGTLRDLQGGALVDGCTSWATGGGPDGPLLVKNRDVVSSQFGVQQVMWHEGPDIATGGMMCLGSLGSPGNYSSGMNAAGLAVADTHIGIRRHRVGWLRYFLLSRILARCATVDEALALVRSVPHAGGGSLILADISGATAAVELGTAHVSIDCGSLSWRTNHFVSLELKDATLTAGGGGIAASSHARFDCMSACLPSRDWSVADAAVLMARHAADPDGAPICQHLGPGEDTLTISSAIFAVNQRCLYLHEGNPCAGRWQKIQLPN